MSCFCDCILRACMLSHRLALAVPTLTLPRLHQTGMNVCCKVKQQGLVGIRRYRHGSYMGDGFLQAFLACRSQPMPGVRHFWVLGRITSAAMDRVEMKMPSTANGVKNDVRFLVSLKGSGSCRMRLNWSSYWQKNSDWKTLAFALAKSSFGGDLPPTDSR